MDIVGSVARRGATGTIRDTVTIVSDTDGSTVTTCRTPALRWTAAHRPGTVFGGLTSQGYPVTIRLKPNRRSVAEIDIGWSADCTPNGSVTVPEQFTNFPIAGGRFGDVFTVKLPSDGGQDVFDYHLSGTLTRSGGSGKFSARAVFPDGSSCQSSAGAWYVNSR